MMEKSALAGEGGGCTPTPFQPITITYKVAVYAPAERANTLNLFHLYRHMYSVVLLLSYCLFRVGKRSWTGRVERSHEGTHQHKLGLVAYPRVGRSPEKTHLNKLGLVAYPRVGRAHNTWETPILNGAGAGIR
jgi:hypothetical protein